MARTSPVFICSHCGKDTPKWQGQCPHCDEWNSLEAGIAPRTRAAPIAAATPRSLDSTLAEAPGRLSCGQEELDRVFGGGIVPGSVTLLGGGRGIGKYTLLLQVAAHVAASRGWPPSARQRCWSLTQFKRCRRRQRWVAPAVLPSCASPPRSSSALPNRRRRPSSSLVMSRK